MERRSTGELGRGHVKRICKLGMTGDPVPPFSQEGIGRSRDLAPAPAPTDPLRRCFASNVTSELFGVAK